MENKLVSLTDSELSFIEMSLNQTWHNARTSLERKDLGDLERKNYENKKRISKELMDKIDGYEIYAKGKKLTESLQKIEQHIDDSGLKEVDIQNKVQLALYHIKHLAKAALKETD